MTQQMGGIGAEIRKHRLAKNRTQQWLGSRIGKSQNWVSMAENGELVVTNENLNYIARALGISVEKLNKGYTEALSSNIIPYEQAFGQILLHIEAITELLDKLFVESKKE